MNAITKSSADLIAARRAAARRAKREAEKAAEAKYQARVALWAARLTRRSRGVAMGRDATYAAERMVADRFAVDTLAHRAPPAAYPGWRTDAERHLGVLLGAFTAAGLPLAAEGGEPLYCADDYTARLSQANYTARRARETATAP